MSARERRPARLWQAGVAAAGVAMAAAGFVFWLRGAQGPGLEGTWTGSAGRPGAGRVFPVEIRLAGAGATMRWEAGLRCSGRLGRTGSGFVFTLDRVQGDRCDGGTLRMFPGRDLDRLVIKVTRQGDEDVTYSGHLSRPS
ncbi:hypothetical protein [Nonomuraea cavernae]|uniref:Uncharacterized protein n=1 Tax=Nonomuraea cavernae TaxID=2045107 RepID=A0A918DNL0_9ACTN|nr:hypothetical protein [Nonomuraea cavernae]MCA2189405.1 hypothetical protein [Nonomuraea cavernae]GGO76873.1 hypothetical protein GCM10012289_55200 [Nonomuraea cavernae]